MRYRGTWATNEKPKKTAGFFPITMLKELERTTWNSMFSIKTVMRTEYLCFPSVDIPAPNVMMTLGN